MTDRRSFLKAAGTLAAAGAVVPTLSEAAPAALPPQLDPVRLAALGDAILPESIGAAGRTGAVRRFTAWLAGYVPVIEEMHGYGDAEITYSPADPAPGWNAQLEALDLLSQRKHRRGFAALTVARRREIVRTQLAGVRMPTLPADPLRAPHVAVALLAHWAASSEATDLAYGVRIQKGECRTLADSPRKPLPLARGS